MNYGLYTSASGMCAAIHRMDTAANNLANAETTAFKPQFAATMARQAVRPEDNVWNLPSNKMLEKLGAGVLMAPTATDFSQGALQTSTSNLNIALQGDGFISVSRAQNGATRLTRDGRLAVNPRGQLVQAGTGLPILDIGGYPIKVDPTAQGALVIGPDGRVQQGNTVAGTIAILKPAPGAQLTKEGQSLYALRPNDRTQAADATIVQHALEASGSDPVTSMLNISDADRAVTANGKMIQIYDELMSRAITTFGRVA